MVHYSVEQELPSMIELFSIQSYTKQEDTIKEFIINKVAGIPGANCKLDSYGNILITKGAVIVGQYYPGIVAHMDTVHRIQKDKYKIVVATGKGGTTRLHAVSGTTKAGIGGDDQCGIWLALKLLEELPILKVVFTVEEEVGAIGASKVNLDFFKDVGYLIEGDRKGKSDLITDVFGEMCSYDFIQTILPIMVEHNFKETTGMLTDVSELSARKVGISCINLSVGYYNPHTFDEYVIVEELLNSTLFVKKCIHKLGYNKFAFDYEDVWSGFNNNYYDEFYKYGYNTKKYAHSSCTCTEDLVNLDCDIDNEMLYKHSGKICICGEELQKRELTYYCAYCNKHFIEYDYR